MAAGSVYKLSVVGRTPTQNQLVNTFFYRALDDTILDRQTDDLIDAFYGANGSDVFLAYRACFGNSIGLDKIEAREVSAPALEYGELPISTTGSGGSTDHLPPQCAAVISWRTGNIGRSFRGRTYIFPTIEENQSAGQWVAGYVTTLSNFATEALEIGSGIATARYELVVWSTVADGVPRATPLATKVLTSQVSILVHTQRRRVTGVGA